MLRAWRKVSLNHGVISVPVSVGKLVDSKSTGGRKLCAEHHQPVEQQWMCPECGDACEETVIGYERNGKYIVPDFKPSGASKTIDIAGWVNTVDVDPTMLDDTYLLWPGTEHDQLGYLTIGRALRDTKRSGMGIASLSTKQRNVVVQWSPSLDAMVLHTCHFTDRVRWDDVKMVGDSVEGMTVPRTHSSVAKQLVKEFDVEFDAHAFSDQHAKALEVAIKKTSKPKRVRRKKAFTDGGKVSPPSDILEAIRDTVA